MPDAVLWWNFYKQENGLTGKRAFQETTLHNSYNLENLFDSVGTVWICIIYCWASRILLNCRNLASVQSAFARESVHTKKHFGSLAISFVKPCFFFAFGSLKAAQLVCMHSLRAQPELEQQQHRESPIVMWLATQFEWHEQVLLFPLSEAYMHISVCIQKLHNSCYLVVLQVVLCE